MMRFLRACRHYFVMAGFFSLFINTLQLTFPLYMLAVFIYVLPHQQPDTLQALTALALVALVVMGLLELLRSRLLVRAGIKLDHLLSPVVIRHMLQDLGRLNSLNYTQGIRDINTLRNYLGGNAIFAFFDVPWIFIYLGIIYLAHPLLGLTATIGAIVILIIGLLQHFLTRKDTEAAEEVTREKQHWFGTSLRTAQEMHCMGLIPPAGVQFSRINDEELRLLDRSGHKGHILNAMGQSFAIFMQVAIFAVGAVLVLTQGANAGVIIAASVIMGRALAPINQGIGAWKQTAGAKSAWRNLSQLLAQDTPETPLETATLKGAVTVSQASLILGPLEILKDINIHLAPGQLMGLAGPNGAGKTTLCRLILGTWAPTQGTVLLDDQEVCRLNRDLLGPFLGYLPQNVELFSGTISENIARLGPVDDEKVLAAARQAGAHDMIIGLPEGYNTPIGDAGQSLSGGQRQRIGLARALYGQPRLVVLDEPNANLDHEGEQALLQALQSLKAQGTTTIMITHAPHLLADADRVVTLEHGMMVGG